MGLPETLKAISDPVRREILETLKTGRKSAGEIAGRFSLTNATVSHHLSKLKQAGLISETKVKNFIYYEVNVSMFEELLVWVYGFGGNQHED